MQAIKSTLALLLLCSCSGQRTWAVQRGTSTAKEHDSSKLVHTSSHLELEFLRVEKTVDCFLIVKGSPIPANPKKPKETLLRIETETDSISVPLIRHSGGQKFSFTEQAKDALWKCLEEKKPFRISLATYSMTIDPTGFEDSYDKFSEAPFIRNPFREAQVKVDPQ